MSNNRNKPCHCGSGKKYKKCHLDRDSQARISPFESGRALKKAMSHRRCYYPVASGSACDNKIIQAHSIRRAADLRALARNNHVLQVAVDMPILMRTGGKPAARLVGINEASTFTGFCGVHDAKAFAPLEREEFSATPEQCFLLFFRAWAREAYTKEGAQRGLNVLRETDKGRPLEAQKAIQDFINLQAEGYELGLRDIALYKAELDVAFLAQKFDVVESVVVWFSGQLPFACSGSFYPYWTVDGSPLQHFDREATEDALALTLLNEGGEGCAVMSWLSTRGVAAKAFAMDILRQPNVADALCRTAYSCLENVYASPDWWDSLETAQRAELVDRTTDGVFPIKSENPKALLPRGASFLSLPVSKVVRVP